MDRAQLLQHFNTLAETPDAVAKLRKLVLELAVQGRLVPQESSDEPVEILLAKNDKCRREAARNDRRADADPQPLLSADDRWEIAYTWSWRALADLVLFVDYRGKTPAKLSSGVRLLTAKNVRKGQINLSPEEFLSEQDYHDWMTRGFPKAGDVLFTTEAPMGNAAVVELTERFALAQRVICFQSYGAVDPSFLVTQILSSQFQFILDKNGTGVTAKGIKASKLRQLPIAVPPLAEQRRIVAKVEELLALCDELETRQTAAREHRTLLVRSALDHLTTAQDESDFKKTSAFCLQHSELLFDSVPALRQAILSLAVQGHLVPQNLKDEPASGLLKTIGKERERLVAQKKLGASSRMKVKELPANSLPEGWVWSPFGEVTFCRDGERIPVNSDERENLAKTYDYYGASGVIDKIDRYLFDTPLLLIGEDGANLINRSTPIAFIAEGKYWVNNHAQVLDTINRTLMEYLRIYINSINLEDYITGMAQPKMNQAQMNSIPIALPPLAEQQRIVAKVDELLRWCDALEARLTAARTTATHLLDATLREILNGQKELKPESRLKQQCSPAGSRRNEA